MKWQGDIYKQKIIWAFIIESLGLWTNFDLSISHFFSIK